MKPQKMLVLLLTLAMLLVVLPAASVRAAGSTAAVDAFDNAGNFDLYSTTESGGFRIVDGKLTPSGDAGEFKAIYKDNGQPIKAVDAVC